MGGVVSAIGDAIGGVVESVGDAVEDVGSALSDVGSAIDDYVIQPILDDPLTAVATVAGAAILGPAIAPALSGFGAAAGAIGAGLGAAAANTTAGLVQGEQFDEAIKGGVIAGVTAGATQGAFDYFGGAEGAAGAAAAAPDEALSVGLDPLDDLLAQNNNFANVDVGGAVPGGAFTPSGDGLNMGANFDIPAIDPSAGAVDPLGDFITELPGMADDVVLPPPSAPAPAPAPSPLNQLSLEGPAADSGFGIKPPGQGQGGFGIQPPSSPYIDSMGGTGLTSDVAGLPQFRYSMDSLDPSIRGMSDSWFGEGIDIYGNPTPSGTVGEYGFTPTPQAVPPALPGTAPLPKTLADKLKSFEFGDINSGDLKGVAGKVVDYAMDNPLTTLAGITLAAGALSQGGSGYEQPASTSSTQDSNFNRPMDLYNYLRSQQNYGDDIYRYGQKGGEHQFFTPAKFELVPKAAATGGLIQMKQAYQAGGRAAPMNPRMMQTGMPSGGMGRGMPMRGGLEQAMQTGNMPPAGGMPMRGGSQGMPQGRPQPVNRNPRTSYYQYGTPPTGMSGGGALNMVRSYSVGGGADGRSDDVDAVLSDGEYVFDAETVALLGNGSSEAGANRLEQMREQIRRQKGQKLAQGKISDDAKSPLSYLKGA
jgi:hypothetical protein